jgi:hypothetical protein
MFMSLASFRRKRLEKFSRLANLSRSLLGSHVHSSSLVPTLKRDGLALIFNGAARRRLASCESPL